MMPGDNLKGLVVIGRFKTSQQFPMNLETA